MLIGDRRRSSTCMFDFRKCFESRGSLSLSPLDSRSIVGTIPGYLRPGDARDLVDSSRLSVRGTKTRLFLFVGNLVPSCSVLTPIPVLNSSYSSHL